MLPREASVCDEPGCKRHRSPAPLCLCVRARVSGVGSSAKKHTEGKQSRVLIEIYVFSLPSASLWQHFRATQLEWITAGSPAYDLNEMN